MKYLEWVDAYLSGELSDAERSEFEKALRDSTALQQEMTLARKILAAFSLGGPDESSAALASQIAKRHHTERNDLFAQYHSRSFLPKERAGFEDRLQNDELFAFEWEAYRKRQLAPVKIMRVTWLRWAAAASVILVLGVLAWWTLQDTSLRDDQLLAHYDAPELFPRTDYALVNEGLLHKGVIGSDEFGQLKLDGLRAFDAKDWPQAIRLLSEYQAKTKPSEEDTPDEINLLNLYIGRAWYELQKPDKAIFALETGIAGVTDLNNYGRLQELIRWHLVLAQLQNHDRTGAKAQLEILQSARQETVSQQAKRLLIDLK